LRDWRGRNGPVVCVDWCIGKLRISLFVKAEELFGNWRDMEEEEKWTEVSPKRECVYGKAGAGAIKQGKWWLVLCRQKSRETICE
jgi:hypothetical protein